jgi:hypothetical protein
MALICAQVVVTEIIEDEGMIVGRQEFAELAQFGLIGSDRVRAAVRFQLKPAEVFRSGGLQVEWHIEAACMLP